MKHLLNTLYVTTQGAWLARDGETVHVRVEGETVLRVPVLTLGGIVCFGNVFCSPFLMGLCAEKNVALSFLTEYGRFLARATGPVHGNVLLRAAREHPDAAANAALQESAGRLASMLRGIPVAASLDDLRGFEGEAARSYFVAFNHLVLAEKDAFRFTERRRRPPLDNINALLSFLYTLLVHDVQAALECVGLDTCSGVPAPGPSRTSRTCA